jgi:drug/metabolite transporter (DMT)-like permease
MQSGAPSRAAVALNFLAVYVVWGSTYLAIRVAVHGLPPFLMAGSRFVVAGSSLYAFTRARGALRPERRHWLACLAVGAFLLVGGNGSLSWAEQRVPSGLAALLVATVPLWMVILEWGTGGARPTWRVAAGLLLGFAGLAVLVGPADLLGGRAVDPIGAAVLVGGSMAWAVGSVLSRRVALPGDPQLATGMEMAAGGALLLLLGTAAGEWRDLHLASVPADAWLGLLYLTAVGSLVGFTAYVWLLRHVSIAKVSTYAYVNPVVAVALGWAVLGEPIGPRVLLAAAVIVAGVVFITSGSKRPRLERPETAAVDAAALAD